MGFVVPIKWYETVEEGDAAAGMVGTILEEANLNLTYRGGPLAEAREIICAVLEGETKIERKATDSGKKDYDGYAIVIYEDADDYVKRVLASTGRTHDTFNTAIAEACAAFDNEDGTFGLAVDAKRKERKPPQPKKLAAIYLNTAKSVIVAGTQAKVEAMFATTKTAFPAATGDTEKDAQALGWAIKAHEDAKAKASLSGYTA